MPALMMILGMSETIGQRAKRLRLARGFTQVALGHEAQVDPSTLTRLENDKRVPDTATLQRIAGALGTSLADLVGADWVAEPEPAYPSLRTFLETERDVTPDERVWLLSQRFAEGLDEMPHQMWWYAQLRGYRLLRQGVVAKAPTRPPDGPPRKKGAPRRA
jgi:transcriptional regulator with XRE-family HTH domain